MRDHPDRGALHKRLAARVDDLARPFRGEAFRFVDPRFSRCADLFAGVGAQFSHGRWLAKGGRFAVYTTLDAETALAESLAAVRYYGFPDSGATPLVLVTAEAGLGRVIDLREGKTRQRLRLSLETILKTDWRGENREDREAITQAWGWALHECEVEGFIAPSAARRKGAVFVGFPAYYVNPDALKVIREVLWPR